VNSIRVRLFVILLAATGLIWFSAAAWIYLDTKRQLQHVLDTRLMEAARMVGSLVASGDISLAGRTSPEPTAIPLRQPANFGYERQLSCQVWSVDGRLIGRSSGAPEAELSNEVEGFSEREVAGEPWRVYAIVDRDKGVRVLVGDRLGLRDRLVADLVRGLLFPAALMVPVLGLLIWGSVGRGLRPLRRLRQGLTERGPEDLSPMTVDDPATEIRPVVDALNGLFGKVADAREHERSFTAFAAHELRTPLAGLRTQVQVALAAQDPDTRKGALQSILLAIDRISRLISQLLAISALDAATEPQAEPILLGEGVEAIADAPGMGRSDVTVRIDPALYRIRTSINRELFHLAVRNLHENAVQHSPAGGVVRWFMDGEALVVEDEGAGIPDGEIDKVTERFFRGRRRSAVGSGLGLAIVEAALRQAGTMLALCNREDRSGLRAAFQLPRVERS
jgi:two-component system, OmpR family, sensor histidine kinase QseC